MNQYIWKQWLLPDVKQNEQKGINMINVRMINRIVPLFAVLTTGLMVFYSVMYVITPSRYLLALSSVSVCVFLFLLAMIVFNRLERDSRSLSNRSSTVLIDLAYWAFSAWGITVSWQMYLHDSQMLIMDVVQIAFSLLICAYPLWGVIRVSISYLILYIILFITDGAAQINPAIYSLMAAMLCFGTVLRYVSELRNLRLVRSLSVHARTLENRSNHDELTGLKNRMALREDFPGFCGKNLWVIMTDVDHFKRYNDTYGHEAGDRILEKVASEIQNYFGTESTYRYGGDEFLIIQTEYTRSEITTLLMVWAEAIRNIHLDLIPEEYDFSCSYGFTNGKPETEEDLREMVIGADQKLYNMKRSPLSHSVSHI